MIEKYKIAKHQQYAKFMMDTNGALGIYYSMGTGKSLIALLWIRDALKDGRIQDALVICPASVVPSWEQAIMDLGKFEGFTTTDVMNIRKAVTIVSFQKTYKVERTPIHHASGKTTYRRKMELRPMVDKFWGAVFVDESHCIGAHTSLQSKAAITLSKLAKYRFIMTGTPVHGGGGKEDFSKLYGQMQFLSSGRAFGSWTDFCNKYVITMDMWHKPRKYKVEECRDLMKRHAIVCRLEDCFDMPGKIEQEVQCPLLEKKVYNDIKEGVLDPYGLEIETAGGQYMKMLQVCSGSLIRETDTMILRTSKDDALGDIFNGTDDPIVVFCNYRASIDRCAEVAKKSGRTVETFDGRSKGDTWKKFQEGRVDTLICQYQSGGVGLNLQRSHIMVFYEPCMSALLMEQAKGRIYRKGQNSKCLYYYLMTPATLERKVLETVRNGVDVSNAMLEEWAKNNIF